MSRRDEYLRSVHDDVNDREDFRVRNAEFEWADVRGAYDAGREHGREEVARMGEAWSLLGIVERLCEAAEHLLDGHSCDSHGHEGVRYAAVAGREWLSTVQAYGWTEPPPPTERAREWADAIVAYHDKGGCLTPDDPAAEVLDFDTMLDIARDPDILAALNEAARRLREESA